MVDISLQIEGQDGLTWTGWKRWTTEVEALGFAGLFRSDHYTNARPPDKNSLEMIVSLTYCADHSQRAHFGPLVSPLSFREPTLLARQAAALDDLSGGRMILGVGAGWQEREHTLFGHNLGDIPTRMNRLEEGLEVITRLLHSDEPVTYEGNFYHLREATLLPRPQRSGGPRIMIGGTGVKRTLPLAVRYADIWNAPFTSPETFHERSTYLDTLLREAGREPKSVKRTLMAPIFLGRDMNELDQQLQWRQSRPELADKSLDEVITALHNNGFLVGTPEIIVEQIHTYANVGVEEIMLVQRGDPSEQTIEQLRIIAEQIIPASRSFAR
ncbi:MAG TPA: TIGR03560 family F420-dependent LLM class oxidoreductase [Ktedonosporobacter sp.]|jgi:F420-dependent oxidoreductase-like protein|nr:TIGR03560 family F420-dependent LLM class oxidoreductase [Ktedonosporobacter sp.]